METRTRPALRGQRVLPREDPHHPARVNVGAAPRRLRTRLYTFPETVNVLGSGAATTAATHGPLRPRVEDHLGAGAIVAALLDHGRSASPEARLAARAYRGPDIAVALAECSSGRELTDGDHSRDVTLAGGGR